MGHAVVARGLVKRYGALTAVDGIDLDIPIEVSFGILGPNGAGKTTTMRMLSAAIEPTAGSLEVLGHDINLTAEQRPLKRRIGVVPQGDTLDKDLTVRENLMAYARYHDLPWPLARQRADELLGFAQLEQRADARIDELSGGMQRRLLIARALVSDPELVILDEPTTGLDPQARHLVWERLRNLRRRGTTLVITTHYMDEAARLCDALVVMDRGRIIAAGTPTGLIRDHVPPRVTEIIGAGDLEDASRVVDGIAQRVEIIGDRVVAYGRDSQAISDAVRASSLDGVTLLERDATLEDVFLSLTGHVLVED